MANEKNLKPLNKRTKDEQREIQKKGGKASARAKAARKTLREELLALLSDGETQNKLSLALIQKASSGDVKAFIAIRDTIGEKPVEKIITAGVDPDVITEVERMVHDDTNAGG